MEEKENFGFCPACGANLPEECTFCPECGRAIGGEESYQQQPNYGYGYAAAKDPKHYLQGKLLFAFVCVVIYALTAVFGGIMSISMVGMYDSLDELLQSSGQGTLEDVLAAYGYDMTKDEIITMFIVGGIVSIVSGALCVVACYMMYNHTKRMTATILIAAASIILFANMIGSFSVSNIAGTVLDVAIGCIMAYLVYSSPESFKD